jgi:hypothetical protein
MPRGLGHAESLLIVLIGFAVGFADSAGPPGNPGQDQDWPFQFSWASNLFSSFESSHFSFQFEK